jgi:YaiO family outer membrane protein
MPRRYAPCMALALALAIAVLSDTNPITSPPWWETRATASVEQFAERLQAWQWHSIGIERRGERLSYGFSAYMSRRFGIGDEGFSADVTSTVWRRGYVNARIAVAPGATVIARRDATVELYQAVGPGWEVAPSIRHMRFATSSVPVYGLAIGKYRGDWYLRGRATLAALEGRTGSGLSALVRRYRGSPTEFLEAGVGAGNEVEVITIGAPPIIRQVSFGFVRGQRLLTRRLGVAAGASLNRDDLLPDRFGFNASLFVRQR